MNSLCEHLSDSKILNKNRRSLENLNDTKANKNMLAIGDGSLPLAVPRKQFRHMKIKDEIKLDLKLAASLSGSNHSRFKLYPIEEVSENDSESKASLRRRNEKEMDARIQKIIEENKKCAQNRPKSSFQKFRPPVEVKELKTVNFNQSEESVIASVFEGTSDNKINENVETNLDGDQKLSEISSTVDSILSYKQSQIQRLAVASSYEYHRRMLQKKSREKRSSSIDPLSIIKTTSTTSSLRSYTDTTSCFGKLFCPFRKSRR